MKSYGLSPIQDCVAAQFSIRLRPSKVMEAVMPVQKTQTKRLSGAGLPLALLFLLATVLLLGTTLLLEPGIGLPFAAFLAMVTLTQLLGRRVFDELTGASNRAEQSR